MVDGIYKWVIKGAEGICGNAVQVPQKGKLSDFCVEESDHSYHSDFLMEHSVCQDHYCTGGKPVTA
jgi:hypothetical protein